MPAADKRAGSKILLRFALADEGPEMRKLDRPRGTARSLPRPREELIASIATDFRDLAGILAEVSAQRYTFDGRQLDCLARASAAVARGIELSDRLSR